MYSKKQRDIMDKLKREDFIRFLDEYYASIGRTEVPSYKDYTLHELKKCMFVYNIQLTES